MRRRSPNARRAAAAWPFADRRALVARASTRAREDEIEWRVADADVRGRRWVDGDGAPEVVERADGSARQLHGESARGGPERDDTIVVAIEAQRIQTRGRRPQDRGRRSAARGGDQCDDGAIGRLLCAVLRQQSEVVLPLVGPCAVVDEIVVERQRVSERARGQELARYQLRLLIARGRHASAGRRGVADLAVPQGRVHVRLLEKAGEERLVEAGLFGRAVTIRMHRDGIGAAGGAGGEHRRQVACVEAGQAARGDTRRQARPRGSERWSRAPARRTRLRPAPAAQKPMLGSFHTSKATSRPAKCSAAAAA